MKQKDRLKIISDLQIPSPCHESWDTMKGDVKERFCDHCAHSVTDLSELTKNQAAKLLQRGSTEKICVRYRRDQAGQIKFRPEATITSQLSRPAAAIFGAVLAAIGLAPSAHAETADKPACEQTAAPQDGPDSHPVMGSPAPPQEHVTMGEPMAKPSPTPDSTPAPAATPAAAIKGELPHPQAIMGKVRAK